MGELGEVTEYLYWSERRVSRLARENGIGQAARRSLAVKADVGVAGPHIQVESGNRGGELTLNEKADRIEAAVGRRAMEDIAGPPGVQFAKGRTGVSVSQFVGAEERPGMMFHIRTPNSAGRLVDVILFGSMDNVPEYVQKADVLEDGWTSSSAPFIEEFLASNGERCDCYDFPDGASYMAVDALQIALHQEAPRPSWEAGPFWSIAATPSAGPATPSGSPGSTSTSRSTPTAGT
ncbi:hypothetical protein ACFQ9X_31305 [Catenulispora yoronensis]